MKYRPWLPSVVGACLTSLLGPAQCVGASYVFRTIDVPGAAATMVNGINNHRHVVGTFVQDRIGYGFLFDVETFTTLTFPGANNTTAKGINDSGQIVGSYGSLTFRLGEHGYLFDHGEYTTLDVPGGTIIEAEDINNHGQITGILADAEEAHAFLLDGEDYSRLTVPGAHRTEGLGLNDAGVVAGRAYEGEPISIDGEISGHWNGFLHDANGLELISIGTSYSLTDINNFGQVVAWSQDHFEGTVRSFVSGTGEIQFPEAVVTMALGLNDQRQVVGYYWTPEYGTHGFIATPVPEPSTLGLTAVGCASVLLFFCRARKLSPFFGGEIES